eukprot:TRINITY_DN13156_c0_g1_i1.p1 TRINITY_DN13156_c0_g1~~TRINITY_DN13156_c0_g1_i1.p1  ORF type:complete len:334 (-),score=49.33 TRINITY_DN13156_c0_g1_i1:70-927(-)
MGKECFMANLSFTSGLASTSAEKYTDVCYAVTADTKFEALQITAYFPEYELSNWFRQEEKQEVTIYTFCRSSCGVKQLRATYAKLAKELDLDTIIVVDGGTDSLMKGDEPGLGTPTEDMLTIASVYNLPDKSLKKFMVCIGFGVDAFHGVNHCLFLENVAELSKQGGFLGSWSLLAEHPSAQKMISAYNACTPRNSIVCASVTSAIEGHSGNYHHPATKNRTRGSKLFINPLMTLYWAFDLPILAKNVLYINLLKDTEDYTQVQIAIHKFHAAYPITRSAQVFPH